ncbi:hypothetical protein BDV26DRAFT_304007 [Aspergillus bertholletiae]|uniref:Protein kinase domain-containing protein n=1 Tax=Aspergillus bertholletiae TaxID=1226010 RepID=A0A5N7BMQ0_9EURO|nr:hypothetical protein BDV26DRAFT_304007 [Aspergillus bertholletiae]
MSPRDITRNSLDFREPAEETDAVPIANGDGLSSLHRTFSSLAATRSNDSSHQSGSEPNWRPCARRYTLTEHATPRTIPSLPQSPERDIYGISPRDTYLPNDHHPFYGIRTSPTGTRHTAPYLMDDSQLYHHDSPYAEDPIEERRQSIQRESKLREISLELQNKTRRRDRPSEKVVPRNSLAEIWSESRLKEFIDIVRPGFDYSKIRDIREEWLQTLSILVDIGWQHWERFGDIFLRHQNERGEWDRSDRMIPTYTLAILEEDSFLGSPWAEKFQASQYTFCPIDIEEGKSLIVSKEWKLPFVNNTSKSIGNGAYGRVTREIIGSGHFRSQSEHHLPGAPYSKDIPVALKQFETRGDFRSETKNLDILRSSLSKHDRIVPFLATVTVGNSFNILSPLADMDLDVFLREGHQRCPGLTVRELMQEAAHLAGALAFLHQGLDSHPPGLSCYHKDLKPGNILVFHGNSADFPRVGKWKISDFGISTMSRPERTDKTVTEFVDEFTHQQSSVPPPAPYRAPDVAGYGLKSDIWSLGCILTRVLALGLQGVNGMVDLDNLRATKGGRDSPYQNDHFYRGSPPMLNPHIQAWLSGLDSSRYKYRQDFLQGCQALIFDMLAISPENRPNARYVRERLHDLAEIAQPIVPRPPSTNTSVGGSASVSSGSDNIRVNNRDTRGDERYVLHMVDVANGNLDIEANVTGESDRPLVHCVKSGWAQLLEKLLTCHPGLDLETPDSHGNTPLQIAVDAAKEHLDVVEILLNARVNIDAPSQSGMTPLMSACRHGHVSTVQLLLDRGANCSLRSQDGYTSLHYATYSKSGATIIQLLGGKVSFNILRSGTEETPLLTLIKRFEDSEPWWNKLDQLLRGGADVNIAEINGFTPLFLAVRDDHCKLVTALRKAGAQLGKCSLPRRLPSDIARALKAPVELPSSRDGF